MRGPVAPASGFSSGGGGRGISSSFGLSGRSPDCATPGPVGSDRSSERLDMLRQNRMPAMLRTKTSATIAYLALLPDPGTPAGGWLVGGLIRKEAPPFG